MPTTIKRTKPSSPFFLLNISISNRTNPRFQMWKFLLAATVATSGLLAKHLFNNGDGKDSYVSEPTDVDDQEKENAVVSESKEEEGVSPLTPNGSGEICDFEGTQKRNLVIGEKGIFRFSSLGSSDEGKVSIGSKNSLKKKRLKGNVDRGKRKTGVGKIEQKLGFGDGEKVMGVEEQRKKGKRFCICLKRRRTAKTAFGKCGSCLSKGSSSSNLGVSIALLYMVSSGKAEINKLSEAVDETTKLVNDLKSKLNKRKLSCEVGEPSCKTGDGRYPEEISKDNQLLVTAFGVLRANSNDSKVLGLQSADDVSSVLTEEPEPEVLEMDQLEAELESELQKISRCTSEEPSGLKGNKSSLSKLNPEYAGKVPNEVLAGEPPGFDRQVGADCNYSKFHGVSPSELDRKLCHLLIEQQESHILELDSKLQLARTKLLEKEAELQALKDCVRHLRDFSLEPASDEETEEKAPNATQGRSSIAYLSTSPKSIVDDFDKGVHSGQKVMVGVKRTMEY